MVATVMRTFGDYDYVAITLSALFLFSGTFVPVTTYPPPVQVLVQLTPLYRGVDLIRGITLGQFGWVLVVDVIYLCVLIAAGLTVASRRLVRKLRG